MSSPVSALIVDDEQHLRMYLKLVLKQVGFSHFFEAANGQSGVDEYRKWRPDLVLMDVNMPVKEGLEALEEILEFDDEAVVVMASSVASRNAVEMSVDLGATYYIRKDMPREEMVSLLKKLVDDIWGTGGTGGVEGTEGAEAST